jgi:isopentenyldiphosphate isomerase
MAELVAVVDSETGDVIGEVDRVVAHRDGIWHASIHVWVVDEAGQILLQQRSFEKDQFPGMWDISAAGHIGAGTDGFEEVAEELGADVTADDLLFVGIWTVENSSAQSINRERPRVYLWLSGKNATSFEFTDGEVLGLAAVTVSQLRELVAGGSVDADVARPDGVELVELSGGDLVPLGASYWEALFKALTAAGIC